LSSSSLPIVVVVVVLAVFICFLLSFADCCSSAKWNCRCHQWNHCHHSVVIIIIVVIAVLAID
jgi:hypothetical protein